MALFLSWKTLVPKATEMATTNHFFAFKSSTNPKDVRIIGLVQVLCNYNALFGQ